MKIESTWWKGCLVGFAVFFMLLAVPPGVLANGDFLPSVLADGLTPVEGWYPLQEGVGASSTAFTTAENDAVAEKLAFMVEALRASGLFARDAEVVPSWSLGGRLAGGDDSSPVRFRLNLRIYRPDVETARSSGGSVSILVNDPYITATEFFKDEHGPIYMGFPVAGDVASQPLHQLSEARARTRQLGWVTTSGGRPQWAPVSRERWIGALIHDARGKLEAFETEAAGGAAQRNERFEKVYEGMKKLSEQSAGELRKQHEARERQLAGAVEALRSGDFDALEQIGRRDLALLGRAIVRLENELAEMPQGERSAPAYCCEANPHGYFAPPSHAKRPSLMVNPDKKGAAPLLAPDPAFFNRDLPASAVQSIAVLQQISRPDRQWDDYMAMIRTEIDWLTLAESLFHD